MTGCSCTFNGSVALSGVHVHTAMEASSVGAWMDGVGMTLANEAVFSNQAKLGIRGAVR